jgi:hypothetical protein
VNYEEKTELLELVFKLPGESPTLWKRLFRITKLVS